MSNGAVYDENGKARIIHDHKLEALEDLIEAANGQPVLVAYWFKHDRQRIMEHLAMICSQNGRMTTIPTKSWPRRRISTGSKAKTRRPCLYCERNKHNRLVIGIKNPTQPCDWVGYMLSLFDFHVLKTDKVSFSDAKATKHFLFRD